MGYSGVHWGTNIHLQKWGKWRTLGHKYTFVKWDKWGTNIHLQKWGKWGTVEYIGIKIYTYKSGVRGVHWGTNIHLQKWDKWGTLGYKYTLEKVSTSAKLALLKHEYSAILDLLTFPPPPQIQDCGIFSL